MGTKPLNWRRQYTSCRRQQVFGEKRKKSDRIDRINRMFDFLILEHNNRNDPVNPVKTDSLRFLACPP
jgi:hypothetical protein